jgi:hypothetical protein
MLPFYSLYHVSHLIDIKLAPSNNKQFFDAKIKFPLPHRVLRHPSKSGRTLFKAKKTAAVQTHFQ